MLGLFDLGGVHSALKHDVIMEADRVERQIIEHEGARTRCQSNLLVCCADTKLVIRDFPTSGTAAERVAREAAIALKASREARQRSGLYEPTWTGRSGQAGQPMRPTPAPAPVRVASGVVPPSSRTLLNALRQRAVAAEPAPGSRASPVPLIGSGMASIRTTIKFLV